ncbi:DNA helicase-2/ATP-dependent DNA helicase PcrA [Rhodococcus sp. OK519]|nr:DNA helicase-2/ATP-dependent DNA helicase PcrA [Rhodococcus sp. OK519]
MGWFTFLLQHCIRPYLPLQFPEQRLRGFNFDGQPVGGRYAEGPARFFDAEGRAYRLHLSRLACDVSAASNGAVVDRLSHIYDEIYIDEVQDLTGCDLLIVEQLMKAADVDVHMVGDVRQSVFDTNPRDPNLKKFRGVKMLDWFELHRASGLLDVQHNQETWRANQVIADFSDTLFPTEFCFEPTVSKQTELTGHDGVFALTEADTAAYLTRFKPQALRDSIATARNVDLPFRNFGTVKGLTFDRVVVYPPKSVTDFLTKGTELKPKTACGLYVAVTRAKHSVAFVVQNPTATQLTPWSASG